MRTYLADVKKWSVDALKRKDKDDRAFWSLVLSNSQSLAKAAKVEVEDKHVLEALLQMKKMLNNLLTTLKGKDDKDDYENPLVLDAIRQIGLLDALLPPYLPEWDIRNLLSDLPDNLNKGAALAVVSKYAEENDFLVDKREAMELIVDILQENK
jgi:hypothetical protein